MSSFWGRFRRKPLGVAGLAVATAIALAAVLAPWIAPYGPNAANMLEPLRGPSGQHLLGTDSLGRDILSRLLWGTRPTLLYTLEMATVTACVGIPLGLVSGYFGGKTDRAVMWLADLGLSVPSLVVVLIVLSVFQSEFWIAVLFFGVFTAPPLTRFIRGSALAVRKEPFLDAAIVAGRSHWFIIRRHILPRVRGAVVVQLTLLSAGGIVLLAGLGFLGFGPQPPTPTWGNMITDAQQALQQSPWLLIGAGGITALMVLSLGVAGDAARDAAVEAWAGAPPRPPRRAPRAAAGRRPAPPAGAAREAGAAGALLRVRDLSVAFTRHGAETLVVDQLSFDVAEGEAVALVGESGCGKTTAASALLRLLGGDGRVTGGSVEFGGQDVLALDGEELRRFRGGAIGYVSQEPMTALDPSFKVGAQLAEAVRSLHAGPRPSRGQVRSRVLELLDLVRLPDPAHVAQLYPHQLSGGMAQRVCIARALAGNPRLLIADEPTTALDVTVQSEILALLHSLREQTHMAVLLVSHDWGVVAQVCEQAIVMYAGQVIEQAPLASLAGKPAHPYTRALLACRPDTVPDAEAPLPAIPGTVPDPEDWPAGCRFADRCGYAEPACRSGAVSLRPVAPSRESRCLRAGDVLACPLPGGDVRASH